MRNQSIPSPYQLYDFLARSVDGSGAFGQRAFDITDNFSEARRHYTDEQALEFAINSWKNGAYYDAHCSVFTPESFVSVFRQISDLGVMNINISTPVAGHEEFFVKIEKIGDPKVKHPSSVDKSVLQSGQSYEELCLKLAHAERAFQEAVEVQQKLKKYNIFCIINNIFNRNFK